VSVRHEAILSHFQIFCLLGQRQSANETWKGMWVVVSKIWNNRNKVVFNGGVVDDEIVGIVSSTVKMLVMA